MNIERVKDLEEQVRDLEKQVEFLTKTLNIIAESEEYHGDSFVCDFQSLQSVAWDGLKQVEG